MKIFLFMLALLPGVANAELMLIESRGDVPYMEQGVRILNERIDTGVTLPVIIKPCGAVNAYYGSAEKSITICSELIDKVNKSAAEAMRAGMDEKSVKLTQAGEVWFVFMHELGHALIDIYKIPVLGGQEAAADMFAASFLLKSKNRALYFGALNFFAEKNYGNQRTSAERLLDVHGLPAQRRANLACWGYGKEPEKFGAIVQYQRMAQNRLQGCGREYQEMMRDTETAFKSAWLPKRF